MPENRTPLALKAHGRRRTRSWPPGWCCRRCPARPPSIPGKLVYDMDVEGLGNWRVAVADGSAKVDARRRRGLERQGRLPPQDGPAHAGRPGRRGGPARPDAVRPAARPGQAPPRARLRALAGAQPTMADVVAQGARARRRPALPRAHLPDRPRVDARPPLRGLLRAGGRRGRALVRARRRRRARGRDHRAARGRRRLHLQLLARDLQRARHGHAHAHRRGALPADQDGGEDLLRHAARPLDRPLAGQRRRRAGARGAAARAPAAAARQLGRDHHERRRAAGRQRRRPGRPRARRRGRAPLGRQPARATSSSTRSGSARTGRRTRSTSRVDREHWLVTPARVAGRHRPGASAPSTSARSG